MSALEAGFSFKWNIFESRGKANQGNNKEKGEDKRPFEAAGLRGNGSKAKEKTGRNHDRSLRRIMKRAKKGKWV